MYGVFILAKCVLSKCRSLDGSVCRRAGQWGCAEVLSGARFPLCEVCDTQLFLNSDGKWLVDESGD